MSAITSRSVDCDLVIADDSWMDKRACIGVPPAVFYPEPGRVPKLAKRVCASCPVAAECLAYALATGEEHGVWGGLSALERRSLQKAPKRPPAAECGTPSGYRSHRRRGEDACRRCREAHAAYAREWKQSA